jgi:hypothetical protein
MLVHFSNGTYLEGALHANKFIQHVFILFASLEDIDRALIAATNGQHSQKFKEPKQLVKKVIYFFSVLSGNQDLAARLAATKEMISLVTSLAHTLKIIIRGALTGAFRLVFHLTQEQLYGSQDSVAIMLNQLESVQSQGNVLKLPSHGLVGKEDICLVCSNPVEEGCLKYEKWRWHEQCLACSLCSTKLFNSLPDAYVDTNGTLFCHEHKPPVDLFPGLERISQLQQFTTLLYIAWTRLCTLLNVDDKALAQLAAESHAREAASYNSEDEPRILLHTDEEDDEEDIEGGISDGSKTTSKPIEIGKKHWKVNEQFSNPDELYLTDLSGLQLMGARQLAALALHPFVEKHYTLSKLLSIIDAPEKKTIWSKMINAMTPQKKPRKSSLTN